MSEDIGFLAEIEALEKEIVDTMPAVAVNVTNHVLPHQPKPPKPKEVRGRKPIKNDLMDKITKLEAALGWDVSETAELKKLTVAKLEEKLANLTTHGLANQYDIIDEKDDSSEGEEEQPMQQRAVLSSNPVKATSKMGATALFQFNLIVARFAELTTKNFEDKLGGNLDGLCADLTSPDVRPELEKILAEIYEENMESIEVYLTATNKYLLFMTGLTANRFAVNKYGIKQ